MNHLDLFSGIGGFSLAAKWVWGKDHNIVCFVEIDEFCQKVLKKHWPNIPIISDIKDFKYNGEKIDLLTGGFPCQPFSCAGSRKGTEDDRYLWKEMLNVIQETRPTWIIGENVAGILSMVQWDSEIEVESKKGFFKTYSRIYKREGSNIFFGKEGIVENLESIGYNVQILVLPACAVDAKHRRDRVWIVANDKSFNDNFNVGIGRVQNKRTNENGSTHLWNKDFGRKTWQQFKLDFGRVAPEKWSSTGRHIDSRPLLLRNDDGIPGRVDRLKSLGNAIVPQVVAPIMQAIKEIENN